MPEHKISPEKATPKQESAVNALVSANQNLIDLIARRYSSPTDTLKNAMANSNVIANARKSTSIEMPSSAQAVVPEKIAEPQPITPQPQTPTSPSSPSTMLNKLSPGNIFKNFFK